MERHRRSVFGEAGLNILSVLRSSVKLRGVAPKIMSFKLGRRIKRFRLSPELYEPFRWGVVEEDCIQNPLKLGGWQTGMRRGKEEGQREKNLFL